MTAVADPTEHTEHDHPTERLYWMVGGVLAVLTALELSTYWWPEEWRKGTAVAIIIMMVIKFILVALYFMHLKFDNPLLRRSFFFGLTLAMVVYVATAGSFTLFKDSGAGILIDAPDSKPVPVLVDQ